MRGRSRSSRVSILTATAWDVQLSHQTCVPYLAAPCTPGHKFLDAPVDKLSRTSQISSSDGHAMA